MIKKSLSTFLFCCASTALLAQTSQTQPSSPGYSQPAPVYNSQPSPTYGAQGYNANNRPASDTFSNQVGQAFSPNQLATQLQNLRAVVDQTLPLLSAFNQSYSNAAPEKQTVGGALSGIVSDVLHHNQSSQNTSQSSLSGSNLLGILRGLLNTNSSSSVASAPANADDLKKLENDLQPIASLLQRLNVSPLPNQGLNTYQNNQAPATIPDQSLSPTGR